MSRALYISYPTVTSNNVDGQVMSFFIIMTFGIRRPLSFKLIMKADCVNPIDIHLYVKDKVGSEPNVLKGLVHVVGGEQTRLLVKVKSPVGNTGEREKKGVDEWQQIHCP